jgi:TP901 family phage tail tape measure protein
MANRNVPQMAGELVLNTTPWKQSVDDVLADLDGMRGFFAEWSSDINRLMNLVAGAAVALGAGLAPGLFGAVKLEQALARVYSVGEVATDEMKALRAATLELGQGIVGPQQLADGLYNLASAGLDVNQQLAAMEPVAQLAAASAVTLDEASQLVVQTMRAFRLEAEDAARIANVVSASNAVSSSNAERLASSYRMVAANAAAANLTLEETTAALNLLINVFQNGEMAGTGLRNVIARLVGGGAQLQEFAREAGIALDDLNPSIVGMGTAIKNLDLLLESGASAFEIFGTEGMTSANILAAAADEFEAMEASISGTNELTKQYEIQASTLQNRLTALKNTVMVTSTSFMQGLVPPLKVATEATRIFAEALNAIPQPIKSALGIIGSLVTAWLLVGFVIQKVLGWAIQFGIVHQGIAEATIFIEHAARKMGAAWGAVSDALAVLAKTARNYAYSQQALIVAEGLHAAAIRAKNVALIEQTGLMVANIRAAVAHEARMVATATRMTAVAVAERATTLARMGATFAYNRALGVLTRSWNILTTAIEVFIRTPLLWYITGALLALREMAKYADVMRVAMNGLTKAGGEWAVMFEGLIPILQFIGKVLTTLALGAVNVLAQAVANLTYAFKSLGAMVSLTLYNLDPRNWLKAGDGGMGAYMKTMREAGDELRTTTKAVNDLTTAHAKGIWGNVAEESTEVARALGVSTEALERAQTKIGEFVTEAGKGAAEIVFSVNGTALEQQLVAVEQITRTKIDELNDFLYENPLMGRVDFDMNAVDDLADSVYGQLLQGYEDAMERAQQILVDNFLADLQLQVDTEWVAALEDGRQKAEAEYQLREAALDKAREEALQGLQGNAAATAEAERLFAEQSVQNRLQLQRELAAIDEATAEMVEGASRRGLDARVRGMEEGTAKIRAQFALQRRDAAAEFAEELAQVEEFSRQWTQLHMARYSVMRTLRKEEEAAVRAHEAAVRQAQTDSLNAFRASLAALERQIERLRASMSDDPLRQMVLTNRETMREYVADVVKAHETIKRELDEGTINFLQATKRSNEILGAAAKLMGLQLLKQWWALVNHHRRMRAETITHNQKIQAIHDQIAALDYGDDEASIEARRDAEIRALEASTDARLLNERWYSKESRRIWDEHFAQLELIEATSVKEREELLQRQLAERVRLESDAARQALTGGVDGLISAAEVREVINRLEAVRTEVTELGAESEALEPLVATVEAATEQLERFAHEARESFADTLGEVLSEIRDLNAEVYFEDEEQARYLLDRKIEMWDVELDAHLTMLRMKIEDDEEYYARAEELEAAYHRRSLLASELYFKEMAERREEDRQKRLLEQADDALDDANKTLGGPLRRVHHRRRRQRHDRPPHRRRARAAAPGRRGRDDRAGV